jgi:hypothetical protein
MDTPSLPPANVQTYRRRNTTILGVVVLTIAGFCLLGSVFRALTLKNDVGTDSGFQTAMLIHNTLVVLSKVGLLVLGICLIRRHPRVRVVAANIFALSLIDSMYFLLAVVPSMRARMSPALAGAFDFGAWLVLVVPAIMYVGILVYLCQPASRQEFRRRET